MANGAKGQTRPDGRMFSVIALVAEKKHASPGARKTTQQGQ
jgi:hypothetical protein